VSVKTSIVHVEADAHQNRAGSLASDAHQPKNVLVIDIGGTSVKLLASGQRATDVSLRTHDDAGQDGPKDPRNGGGLELFGRLDWLSRPVLRGRPICEPYNLGGGWVGFNFAGLMNIFSLGMDSLAEEPSKRGVYATVMRKRSRLQSPQHPQPARSPTERS
jgi:hypothetical protein